MPATLLRPWHRCFPVNFAKFLRTHFLQNTSRRLLLCYYNKLVDARPCFNFQVKDVDTFLTTGRLIFRPQCFLGGYFMKKRIIFKLQPIFFSISLFGYYLKMKVYNIVSINVFEVIISISS